MPLIVYIDMENLYVRTDKPKAKADVIWHNKYNRLKRLETAIVVNEGKENEFVLNPEKDLNEFTIIKVSRADMGYDEAHDLTDSQMEAIADKMLEYICESGTWNEMVNMARAM